MGRKKQSIAEMSIERKEFPGTGYNLLKSLGPKKDVG